MAPAVLLSDVVLPFRRLRRRPRFVAGFGADGDSRGADVMAASARACRRRLAHCLRQHREFVAVSPHGRAAFEAALADLQCLDGHGARSTWSYRVHVDGIDVTFWLRDVNGWAALDQP